jgi:protoheme IX farnesyltransferase
LTSSWCAQLSRPLVTGVISRKSAIIFASCVGILSLIIFWIFTTALATLLALIAILFYVIIYTIALKQRTDQNIVWGGAAGCMPALIGWAAVTNSLALTPVLFFFVIFFWTPPHFWALAIRYKDDYSKAGIPMLPVVATRAKVRVQMWLHTVCMVVTSLLLIYHTKLPWWTFLITLALGLVFIVQLFALKDGAENYDKVAGKIFQWSITYLSLFSLLLIGGQLAL